MKMKTLLIVAALGAGATMSVAEGMDAACALAKEKPFSVSLGLGTFTNSTAGDYSKSNGLTLGFGYKLGMPCMLAPGKGMTGVDVSYFRTSGNGNRITNLGLTAGSRIFLDEAMSFYGRFGVGVYQSQFKTGGAPETTGGSPLVPSAGNSETLTRFGAVLGVGYRSAMGYSLEANYHLLGKRQGVTSDYFEFSVGFSF